MLHFHQTKRENEAYFKAWGRFPLFEAVAHLGVALSLFAPIAFSTIAPLLWGQGCSTATIDSSNPEALYQDAEGDINRKRYIQAQEKLRTVKNKFPYSPYSAKAALRLGDVLFLQENFLEAAANYEAFADLHPKWNEADYVHFRIGESYYNMIPGSTDRDLSPATKAIEAWKTLETLYPQSSYVEKSKPLRDDARQRLANKELYIAEYYAKRGHCDSAVKRFEKIASLYAKTSTEESIYPRWVKCLHKMNQDDEAKHRARVYLEQFPEGRFRGQMEQWQTREVEGE